MIRPMPSKRISITGVSNHPLFQSTKMRFAFIAEVCQKVETKVFSDDFISRLEWNLGKFDWRRHQGLKMVYPTAKKSIFEVLKSVCKNWNGESEETENLCPHLFAHLYQLVTLNYTKDSDWFINWYGADNAEIIAKNFWYKKELSLVIPNSRHLLGHNGRSDIRIASWCPNSNILATTGSDGAIIFWRLWEKQVSKVVKKMSSVATAFDWSHSGNAAVGFEDGSAQIFFGSKKNFTSKSLTSHHRGGRITCLKWSRNSRWIISGGTSQITIWDIRNGNRRQLDQSTMPYLSGPVYDLLWKNNKRFACHTKRQKIFVADLSVNGLSTVENFCVETDFELSKLTWCVWGNSRIKVLALGSCEGDIKIWNVNDKKVITCGTLVGHCDVILSFDQSCHLLASSSMDKTVRIWSTIDGTALHTLTNHNSLISCLKFSPNGESVATSGHDGCIYFWSKDGRLLHAYKSNSKIYNCSWNTRGDQLATSGADGSVSIIELVGSQRINPKLLV